jgi:hypothetical protein
VTRHSYRQDRRNALRRITLARGNDRWSHRGWQLALVNIRRAYYVKEPTP